MNSSSNAAPSKIADAAIRVPQITAYFWLVKILSTGAGETTSDWLGRRYGPAIMTGTGLILLVGSLVMQFRMRRYVPWAYWLAVSAIAIFGTMFADGLHDLHLSYVGLTVVLLGALAVIFAVWYWSEKTLSIHSITTTRREIFYWSAVMATFAMGTALGDLTADQFGWGYLGSGVVFTIAFAACLAAYVASNRPQSERAGDSTAAVFSFWLAYILTRPLGASFADWGASPTTRGGLGLGHLRVSVVLWAVIVLLVWFVEGRRTHSRQHS